MLWEIKDVGEAIQVTAPFCPELKRWALGLKGRYEAASGLTYSAAQRDAVVSLYRTIYGTPELDRATLEIRNPVSLCDQSANKEIFLAGRKIASCRGKDSSARDASAYTTSIVKVIAGGFGSGGTLKNPQVKQLDGTVIHLSDIPMDKALELVEKYPKQVKLIVEDAPKSVPPAEIKAAPPAKQDGAVVDANHAVILMRDAVGDIASRFEKLRADLDQLSKKQTR